MPDRIWAWKYPTSSKGKWKPYRDAQEDIDAHNPALTQYIDITEHKRLLAEAVERALSHQPNAETQRAMASTDAGDVIECKGFTDLMDKLEEEETDAKT